jgi:hypothetical protein
MPPDDAKWIAARRTHRTEDVERAFGLPRGCLSIAKGKRKTCRQCGYHLVEEERGHELCLACYLKEDRDHDK